MSIISGHCVGREGAGIHMGGCGMQSFDRSGVAVASAMDRSFVRSEPIISRDVAQTLLQQIRQWGIIEYNGTPVFIMLGADLARSMRHEFADPVDFKEIPPQHVGSVQINIRATMHWHLNSWVGSSSTNCMWGKPRCPVSHRHRA